MEGRTHQAGKRRVVFCTYPSLYSSIVLETLLQNSAIQLVGVVCSSRVMKKNRGWLQGARELVNTSGLRYLIYLFCLTDLFSLLQPLSPLKGVASHAGRMGLPLHSTRDINEPDSLEYLEGLEPDIILSAHFNQLIKEPVLSLPKIGCINIHPSLLPDYKGVDPVFHALNNAEPTLGVTVHLMDPEFDCGNILAQASMPVDPERSLFGHCAALFRQGARKAAEQIAVLEDATGGSPQQGEGRYDSWPGTEAVNGFLRRGGRLLSYREYCSALFSR